MTHKLVQGQIDRALDAHNRAIFQPKQKYAGSEPMGNPVIRKPENLIALSDTVSEQMIKKHKQSLADILKENNNHIVYVDCSRKGIKDLMAYIVECFILTFIKKEDQEELVKKIMVSSSPLNSEGRTKRQAWVDDYQ